MCTAIITQSCFHPTLHDTTEHAGLKIDVLFLFFFVFPRSIPRALFSEGGVSIFDLAHPTFNTSHCCWRRRRTGVSLWKRHTVHTCLFGSTGFIKTQVRACPGTFEAAAHVSRRLGVICRRNFISELGQSSKQGVEKKKNDTQLFSKKDGIA